MMRLLISMIACMANRTEADDVKIVTTDEVKEMDDKANDFMMSQTLHSSQDPAACDCYGKTVGFVDEHGECQCDENLSDWKISDLKNFLDNYGLHNLHRANYIQVGSPETDYDRRYYSNEHGWAVWGKISCAVVGVLFALSIAGFCLHAAATSAETA